MFWFRNIIKYLLYGIFKKYEHFIANNFKERAKTKLDIISP